MELQLTSEQISQSISAAYDSVNLINTLKIKEVLTEEETNTLKRNEDHIKIMLTKEWFENALTSEQKTELSAI